MLGGQKISVSREQLNHWSWKSQWGLAAAGLPFVVLQQQRPSNSKATAGERPELSNKTVRVRASTCYLHQVQLNICILWCYYYMQDCSIAKWAGKTPCGANSLIVCVWRSSSLINHPIHPKSIANCALADSPKWKVVALLCVKPKLQNTLSVQDLRLFWYNLIMWSFLIWGSLFLQ